MKKNTFIALGVVLCATLQTYAFQPAQVTPSEASGLMEDGIAFMTSARAGSNGSNPGNWEIRSVSGANLAQTNHQWAAWGVEQTLVFEFDTETAHMRLTVGNDTVARPVVQQFNAMMIELRAGGFPINNTTTITAIRINGEDYSDFAPMEVEVGHHQQEYLLVTELPRRGPDPDSFTLELDVVLDSLWGVGNSQNEWRIDVCGITVEETSPVVDPTTLEYIETVDTSVHAGVNAGITVVRNGSGQISGANFSWTGKTDRYYVVEVSTDLVHWERIQDTYFLGDGATLLNYLHESEPGNVPKRMYFRLWAGVPQSDE